MLEWLLALRLQLLNAISRAITSGVRTGVWKAENLDLSDWFRFLNVRFFPFREVKRRLEKDGQCLNGPYSHWPTRPNDSCSFTVWKSTSLYLPYASAIR